MFYTLLTLALCLLSNLRCRGYRIALCSGRDLPAGFCRRVYSSIGTGSNNGTESIISLNTNTELKPAQFSGRIVLIDSENAEHYQDSAAALLSTKCVGFDLEYVPDYYASIHRQSFDRTRPAVIQIASNDICLVYLMYKIGHLPSSVSHILSDPDILKISHGAPSDMRLMYRHFGVRSRSFVDLQSVCEELQLRPCSLKSVVQRVLGLRLSKKQQCSNWEAAELSQQQIKYAATDAWVTLAAFLKLKPKSLRKLVVNELGDVQVDSGT
ncbi:3'-5' exonuclease domain containing protein [Babesia bovis T2Bo]|uniref:3'-5' exonuclease domain containing protein n=1 Tax=Babesia bovis T2Bo TaxID=484906 RepID=UPI001C35BE45|nr:3'-5' exonuclease domain containing protein [Babesia bovis T2Bo]EDO08598.2 3'-5' exonuclease domain containing protein [Babesia bovis T2Bo]